MSKAKANQPEEATSICWSLSQRIVIMVNIVCVICSILMFTFPSAEDQDSRPQPNKRKFKSDAIENYIQQVKNQLADKELGNIFEATFANTLDTTIEYFGKNSITNQLDTYIITGDIKAMWQRDSTNQVLPYLSLMSLDPKLKDLILGLINRQIQNVLLDPYANAFTFHKYNSTPFKSDKTQRFSESGGFYQGMPLGVWERKYEIDSIAAVLKLQVMYVRETNDPNPSFMNEDYFKSLNVIHKLLTEQQLGSVQEDAAYHVPYTFQRQTERPFDTTNYGRGNPSTGANGMVKSWFRPSDDACTFAFFIPGNAMLATYLKETADMIADKNQKLSEKFLDLSQAIYDDIYRRGVTKNNKGETVFAFEVDGFGNAIKMDDANLPSLLSLPTFGFIDVDSPIYQATRKMILDPTQNPYFFKGKAGEGIGGPHVGPQQIWPMSIITRAMTTDDDNEIIACLKTLKASTAGTMLMHESFDSNDFTIYTRKHFAWANSYFSELIQYLLKSKPHLLTNPLPV